MHGRVQLCFKGEGMQKRDWRAEVVVRVWEWWVGIKKLLNSSHEH